jgi:[glutamine synthetase] adenylyltransferase / [glutamine synthetase]-adenylyl-L-tyrosine phosphorylase
MPGKPIVADLVKFLPEFDVDRVEEFLLRLPDRYFDGLDTGQIAHDAEHLFNLKNTKDHALEISELPEDRISCTLYAGDVPGLFSLLTGLLSATGFDIDSGEIFTYSREFEETISTVGRGRRPRRVVHTREKPRYIIDRFSGGIRPGGSYSSWRDEFIRFIDKLFMLLSDRNSGAIAEARQMVYEEVSRALIRRRIETSRVLLPVEMSVSQQSIVGTNLKIISENTPFFLFSVSNALALYGFSIESVAIHTIGNRIEDIIEITDRDGMAVTDQAQINQVKMSVLLTKQFTYFLGSAPDPYSALLRFETISKELVKLPAEGAFEPLLSNPDLLRDLSRLLSASDFLWEDFIRVQYESILPLLDTGSNRKPLSIDDEDIENAIERALDDADGFSEKRKALNDFKNSEIYLIDLDHIVRPEADFLFLSRKLTRLAEVVIRSAVKIATCELASRFGKPLTFAGIEARYAIMGLGKVGGAALGYASDIELLFIYADNGNTDGEKSIGNTEYFERLFKTAVNLIDTKREGIFRIDLRLRPYGSAGPVACSLESFCGYYAPGGHAHSYEKLALIRMRSIGGDAELGARIERLRDEYVYRSDSIELRDLRELREKQLAQHAGGSLGRAPNAKFSSGGLVDLEYSVQIIQCRLGTENLRLRTPKIHVALEELVRAGVMSGDEAEQLADSYHFLRKLINSLRMLRGSAKDLFLPDFGSDEYIHLARRAGYTGADGLDPAQTLRANFRTKTAVIRSFIEIHLGRDSIPGPPGGNAADLILSETMPEELASRILAEGGLRNHDRALKNIGLLKGEGTVKRLFAGLAVLAWDYLRDTPDPDMALNNWERFTGSLPSKEDHYRQLLNQPLQLEIFLGIFAGSQFLADTVIREPDLISWIAQPELIRSLRKTKDIRDELDILAERSADADEWMRNLRALRKREILRIGTRDICLGVPFTDVVAEISRLADAILQAALARVWKEVIESGDSALEPSSGIDESCFAVFAFGKLGGTELNYSSDIDLLALFDADTYADSHDAPENVFSRVMERLRSHLADHTESGFVYRVDFRLRPYGSVSGLAHSLSSISNYYRDAASDWERQALIKLRPVAGDLTFGSKALSALTDILRQPNDATRIAEGIHHLRDAAASRRSNITKGVDIKSGEGGIRDIEFLIQGLQLIHVHEFPDLLLQNTLSALAKLTNHEIIPSDKGALLKDDYLYLRRIEHFLQLLEDRQVHVVPTDPEALDALARRIEGKGKDPVEFRERVTETMTRIRSIYDELLPMPG